MVWPSVLSLNNLKIHEAKAVENKNNLLFG